MHFTFWSCWLRIVSIAIAVLPVERSPMISSRWPRPTFVIESIALMPVWSGSFTGWRSITPGAFHSTRARLGRLDRAEAVERVAERVDDAAEQRLADRHRRDLAGAADRLALLDLVPLAEERGADVVLLEVEREADDAVLELEHLEREAVLEAVDAGDAVADLQHGADLGEVRLDVEVLDPLAQDRRDLFGAKLHLVTGSLRGERSWRSRSSRPRTLASSLIDPAWRTMPPIRSGSTLRVGLHLAAGRGLDLSEDRRPNSSSESSVRGRQLDVEDALLRRDERVELVGDLRRAPPARPFSATQAQEVDDELVRALRRRRDEHVRLHPRVDLGVLEQRSRGLGGVGDRVAQLLQLASGRRRACRRPAPPRRARARRCGARRLRPAPFELREVDLGERLVDQALLVGAGRATCA